MSIDGALDDVVDVKELVELEVVVVHVVLGDVVDVEERV